MFLRTYFVSLTVTKMNAWAASLKIKPGISFMS